MDNFSIVRSLLLIIVLILLAGVLYAWGMNISRPELALLPGIISDQSSNAPNTTPVIPPQLGTVIGTFVCLPPANRVEPQTLECAFGVETDERLYYALDFNTVSGELGSTAGLSVGDRFIATGLVTPLEQISSGHWRKYRVSGIFSVTSIVQKF